MGAVTVRVPVARVQLGWLVTLTVGAAGTTVLLETVVVADVLLLAVSVTLVTAQVSVPEALSVTVGGTLTVTAVLVQAVVELSELDVVTLKLYTPADRPLTVAVLVEPIRPPGPRNV